MTVWQELMGGEDELPEVVDALGPLDDAVAGRKIKKKAKVRRPQHRMTPDERRASWQAAAAKRRQARLDRCEIVPLEPFQHRFRELERTRGLTMGTVCARMGWTRNRPGRPDVQIPDVSKGARMLGFKPYQRGRHQVIEPAPTTVIDYESAVRLADALGMDPHEGGV
jgi:hypothetical protein